MPSGHPRRIESMIPKSGSRFALRGPSGKDAL